MSFFRSSDRVRVIVSRLVPMSWAISVMGQRKPCAHDPFFHLPIRCRREQEFRNSPGDVVGQDEGANQSVRVLTISADVLYCSQTGIAVLFEKPEEVRPVYKGQLAGLHRFHRDLIRLAGNNSV
jgi:hypothetical protein